MLKFIAGVIVGVAIAPKVFEHALNVLKNS